MKANQPVEWKPTSVRTLIHHCLQGGVHVVHDYFLKSLQEIEAHASFSLLTCPKACFGVQITTLSFNIPHPS